MEISRKRVLRTSMLFVILSAFESSRPGMLIIACYGETTEFCRNIVIVH